MWHPGHIRSKKFITILIIEETYLFGDENDVLFNKYVQETIIQCFVLLKAEPNTAFPADFLQSIIQDLYPVLIAPSLSLIWIIRTVPKSTFYSKIIG